MSVPPESSDKQPKYLTVGEYLTLEQDTQTKYEYHGGWVTAQAGGSFNHGKLSFRIARGLADGVESKGSNCQAFSSDNRLYIEATSSYVYPDAMVVCGKEEFAEENKDSLTNPTLLVEVLSPSTEGYDRGDKFVKYQQIPSLKEYLLISQNEPTVELYTRNPEGSSWRYIRVSGLDQEITLSSLAITISLAWLFQNIEFE